MVRNTENKAKKCSRNFNNIKIWSHWSLGIGSEDTRFKQTWELKQNRNTWDLEKTLGEDRNSVQTCPGNISSFAQQLLILNFKILRAAVYFLFVSKTLSNTLLTHCAVWQFAAHSAHTLCAEITCLWSCQDPPTPKLLLKMPTGTSPTTFSVFPFWHPPDSPRDSSILIISYEIEAVTFKYLFFFLFLFLYT